MSKTKCNTLYSLNYYYSIIFIKWSFRSFELLWFLNLIKSIESLVFYISRHPVQNILPIQSVRKFNVSQETISSRIRFICPKTYLAKISPHLFSNHIEFPFVSNEWIPLGPTPCSPFKGISRAISGGAGNSETARMRWKRKSLVFTNLEWSDL